MTITDPKPSSSDNRTPAPHSDDEIDGCDVDLTTFPTSDTDLPAATGGVQ
jgi:hypothetical protein